MPIVTAIEKLPCDNLIYINVTLASYLKYNTSRQNSREENTLKSSKLRLLIRP